jgi:alkanesulfonate monooxygenase SsuD/methylene tetrahydromethanopterin reductase-like flavin-dependent oxidoreductase (luciferase family)
MTRSLQTARPLVLVALSRPTLADLLDPGRATELPHISDQLDSTADALILGSDLVLETEPSTSVAPAGIDPTIAAITLAHHTHRVGLIVAAAPHRDHPYNLARRLASIDHASAGRAGLFIGSIDRQATAGSPWTQADPVAAAADAVVALRALWRSFPVDVIIADRDTGVFAESHRILAIDHRGAFDIDGPLQVPWSPQIWPPVLAWSDGAGGSALEQVADVVVGPSSAELTLHAVRDLAELRELLSAAPKLTPSAEDRFPLRARFGLAPADPPAGGRAAFPDPSNSSEEDQKVISHAR